MFPRPKRVPRSDFSSSIKTGRRISSPNFSAVIPKNATGYAVVVSKKTARLSVTRHRIKRRVLGAFKQLSSPIPASVILYPRASVLDMEYDELKRELIKLLS